MVEPTPLVSIIMPCFKMGGYIPHALDSVAYQKYRNWEVIATDDCGPDDGTRDAIESFAARYPARRVEYIRHDLNRGVSAARNTAIAAARGEFLALLDPDDLWLPDHLSTSVAALLAGGSKIAVVTSPVEIFWDHDKEPPRALKIEKWKRERFPRSLALHNFIQPSATLIRRDAVLHTGGFDVSPALQHIEDYDLWIRLVERGYRFLFLNEVTSRYRRHESAATADPEKGRQRNHELCARHVGFFIRMQGELIEDAHADVDRLESALRHPIRWLASRGKQRLTETLSHLKGRGS